jgi:segregation and condensation protein A
MEFKLENFQGPLALLLSLIEKEELDITEIGLANICDQYIDYINNNNKISPDEMAEFLLVAAKLLYIKSKTLLPYLYNDEEEEEGIKDLKIQLRMYKEFISASENIKKLAEGKRFSFAKPFKVNQARKQLLKLSSFIAPKELSPDDIKNTFQEILKNLEPRVEKIEEDRLDYMLSIDDRINYIQGLLKKNLQASFSSLINSSNNKTEVIVNFLALLELAKQRQLNFKQHSLFGEIDIFLYKESNL